MQTSREIGTLQEEEDGPSDSELVRLFQSGNSEAFGKLYDRYLQQVYYYCYRRLNSQIAVAEDITSKVFFKALESLQRKAFRIDHERSFIVWLYTIAHNLITNYYRDEQNRKNLFAKIYGYRLVGEKPPTDEEEAILNEKRALLTQAVLELSPEKRKIICLRFLLGMTNSQIGEILGKSEGAVKGLIHRTLKSLGRREDVKGLET